MHSNGTTYMAAVNHNGSSGYFWVGGWESNPVFSCAALIDPGQPFRVIDLTTSEQCQIGETFTPFGAWEPIPQPPPLREVAIYLPITEAGNTFTIHSQADGGAEMLQSAMANPVSIWSSFTAADGTYYMADYPWGILNFATISVVIGEGMTFWVTRDYDGADPQSDNTTRFYLDPANIPEGPWMLNAQFTPIPMVWREFYIATSLESEPWWSNGIFVYQPGGFSQIVDTSSVVYSTPDVDYLGNDHSFYYWTHHALVRPNQPYWIAYPNSNVFASSTTNPNDYQWTMLTSNSSENTATGGWTPLNGVAPPGAGNDLLRIFIPESRTGRDIRLYRGHPWDANSIQKEFSMWTPFVDIITNPWNSEQRLANSMMMEGGGPYTAADPLGWFLLDVDANEVKELHGGENDLRDWTLPHQPKTVQVSLSRWGHTLMMRCEDGSEFPLVSKSWSQGDISTLNDEAHFNPYYYFDATFPARPGLNWFVWDETMQEAAPINASYLIDWFVAPPVQVGLVEETSGEAAGSHRVSVAAVVTQNTAFCLERRAVTGGFEVAAGEWEVVGVSDTMLYPAAAGYDFYIPLPTLSGQVQFRARSLFGGSYSNYSATVTTNYVAPFVDSDDDGLEDNWELAWGLNPNVADSHLRFYGMETALERFQANAGPPPAGETTTPAWTTIRRVHLWQTPYYDGSSNPQLHPSHYVLTWDLPDPALTGNVQIRVETEEGQWATQSTVAVTDQYVRVAAPARSIDPVKIRKRLVVGEHEEFNYKLIGAVTSNESQVKVRLRTRSRSVYRVNPAIVQFFPYFGSRSGLTDLRFKKSVAKSEWNYEDTRPAYEFKDTGTYTYTNTVDTATGKTTWKTEKSWSDFRILFGGPPGNITGESKRDEKGYSEEVDTFQSISPIPSDPYTRVAPQGLANYISTHTFGSGKPADPTIWTITETDTTYAAGTTPQTVSTTTSGEKHSLNQSTTYNDLGSDIVGSENKKEWENKDTDGTSTSSWKKETIRDESGGTVTVNDGTPTTTTGVESVNNRFVYPHPFPNSASPSYYLDSSAYLSLKWGSKITIRLSEPYSDLTFLSDIALAIPQPIPTTTIWEDSYEDSHSDFQTQWLENVTYPTYDLTQGGIVAESRLTERGLRGEVMKSEYWLECNDCLPGGTALAIETWEQESSFGKTFTGNVRSITLQIGAKEGRATKSIVYDSMVPPGVWNQTRSVNLRPVKVTEVSFSGAKYCYLRSDRNVGPAPGQIVDYMEPHWRDTNGDNQASTDFNNLESGERNYPVAFTRNSFPKVKAKFHITGIAAGTQVRIKATSPQGPQFPEKATTVSADGTFETALPESATPWPNTVRFWSATGSETFTATGDNAFSLDWEINVDSGGWVKLGRTKHTVYITYADPITTALALRSETLFNIGCRNAIGGTEPNLIVPAIYSEFTDRWVERVKPSSGERDGDPMEYWATENGQGFRCEDLLRAGTAACGAWARFFINCLHAQGIDAELSVIAPKKLNWTPSLEAALGVENGGTWTVVGRREGKLLIKNWNTDNHFTPVDQDGIKGQHNDNPNSKFDDHSVARYGGKIYDPSYGGAPVSTLLLWEDDSLQAIGVDFFEAKRASDQAIQSGSWIFRLNDPQTEETTISPQSWETQD